MADIEIPDFISEFTVDNAHEYMLSKLSDKYEKAEGSHIWNLTRPFAYLVSFLVQFVAMRTIRLIWPQSAWGIWLDYHAEARHTQRREGVKSSGTITVTGTTGTIIPAGSLFGTSAASKQDAVYFETTEDTSIGDGGTADLTVTATVKGTSGNVAAGTVTVNADKIQGISSVINSYAMSGGLDDETDEDLSARLVEIDQTQDLSYIGNKSDYRRWAMEVEGVGNAIVLSPDETAEVENDSGIVTIVITGYSGEAVSDTTKAKVYNHIMDPDIASEDGTETEGEKSGYDRLAPINARLRVVTPANETITISATVLLDGTKTLETVKSDFLDAVSEYLPTTIEDGYIRYTRIGAILDGIAGVKDYSGLLVSGGTANIAVSTASVPVTDATNVNLTTGGTT